MKTFETPGSVVLHIALGAGEVAIETGDQREVVVEVVPLRDDAATREAAAQTRIELVERRGRHEVFVEAPKRRSHLIGRDARLGVHVRCPHGSDLELSAASADLDVRGRLGVVRAKTASGELGFGDVDGSLDARTASGDISAAAVAGPVSLSTASGDATLRTARGSLSASLVSGDLDVADALGEITVNTVSGDIRIDSAGGGPVRLQTVSGDVEIGVRAGLCLLIDATSLSGTMTSDLEVTNDPPADDGPVVEIRARTVSGDVHIRRAGQA